MGDLSTQDPTQLVWWRALQLVVATVGRPLVRTPASERGGMPEAIALEVVVGDLADALDAQRLP
jgi:hypothetical protein